MRTIYTVSYTHLDVYKRQPFNKQNEYICKLRYLMSLDDTSLCYMRNNAIKKSELYDINKVVFEWEKLFNELI